MNRIKAYKVLWASVVFVGALNYVAETIREIRVEETECKETEEYNGLFGMLDSVLAANASLGIVSIWIKVKKIISKT